MNFIDSFLIAIRSIKANKVRSFLTMLGVIIGIASVIVLVAIGEAAKQYVVMQMQSFGMNASFLQVAPGKNSGDYMGFLDNKLRLKHADEIRRKCPSVLEVLPIVAGKAKLKYGKKEYTVNQGWGVSENYPKVFSHKVVKGRFFNLGEEEGNKKVCVIGQKIVDELFGGFTPLGEKIKVNGRKFTVIGVFEKRGKVMIQDMDDVIALPVTTAISLFNTKSLVEIDIIAKSPELLPQAVKEIKTELGKDIDSDNFHIETQEGMMSMINNIIGMLTSVIGGIAAISLLVGGIGIMNIMLVSVTERTKEIGIRKAVGARKRDIFAQFLVESVVVSFLGGIGGIILGLGGTFLIMYIIKLGMVVVVWALTLACSVSIAIGVISGVYPAMRAVNLDPIEALRYE